VAAEDAGGRPREVTAASTAGLTYTQELLIICGGSAPEHGDARPRHKEKKMNFRTIGLLVMAAMSLLAFASSASATKITSPTGTTSTAKGKVVSEGHIALDNAVAKIECAGSAESTVESHGGAGVPATGNLTALSFTNCTNSWHVTVVAAGSSSINHTSGYNGSISTSGATIETTRFGVICRYATEKTSLGTVTSGGPATVDIAASIPFHGGSALCGTGVTALTGSLKGSTSTGFFIDAA